MTPHLIKPEQFPIYRGIKWEHVFEFQDDDENPLNLTGLGPFYMDFATPSGHALPSAVCTVDADPTTGLVSVVLAATQTILFPLGEANAGFRDSLDNAYALGAVPVRIFTRNNPPT